MNTLKKEVRAIKAAAKKEAGMTRQQAILAIKKTYEKTGSINPIQIALMTLNERFFVVTGRKSKTASDRKREKLAKLSPEQKAGIDAAINTGKKFGEIAAEFNTTVLHVSLVYGARFKKTTQYVLKPVKGGPVCA